MTSFPQPDIDEPLHPMMQELKDVRVQVADNITFRLWDIIQKELLLQRVKLDRLTRIDVSPDWWWLAMVKLRPARLIPWWHTRPEVISQGKRIAQHLGKAQRLRIYRVKVDADPQSIAAHRGVLVYDSGKDQDR